MGGIGLGFLRPFARASPISVSIFYAHFA